MSKRIVILNVEESLIRDLHLLIPSKDEQSKYLLRVIQNHLDQHKEKIEELKKLEEARRKFFEGNP